MVHFSLHRNPTKMNIIIWFNYDKKGLPLPVSRQPKSQHNMSKVPVKGVEEGPSSSQAIRRPCIFYKLMVYSILQDKKLKIPGKFVKQHGSELSRFAMFTVPDGRIWAVGLQNVNDGLWFHSGWEEFVKFYSIRPGHFLIFSYEGHSEFHVRIFDLIDTEITYSGTTLGYLQKARSGSHNVVDLVKDNTEADHVVEILGSGPPCSKFLGEPFHGNGNESRNFGESLEKLQLTKDMRSLEPFHGNGNESRNFGESLEKLQPTKDVHCLEKGPQPSQDIGLHFNGGGQHNEPRNFGESLEKSQPTKDEHCLEKGPQPSQDIGLHSNGGGQHTSTEEIGFPISSELQGRTWSKKRRTETAAHKVDLQSLPMEITTDIFMRRWRSATVEERKRAICAADMFNPSNPFFKVILQPSYVYKTCFLKIPISFSREYLHGVTRFITLQASDGKRWSVKCLSSEGQAKLSKGWAEFVLENKLEEGDVCVFELINASDIVFKVSVFRVLKDVAPLISVQQP